MCAARCGTDIFLLQAEDARPPPAVGGSGDSCRCSLFVAQGRVLRFTRTAAAAYAPEVRRQEGTRRGTGS